MRLCLERALWCVALLVVVPLLEMQRTPTNGCPCPPETSGGQSSCCLAHCTLKTLRIWTEGRKRSLWVSWHYRRFGGRLRVVKRDGAACSLGSRSNAVLLIRSIASQFSSAPSANRYRKGACSPCFHDHLTSRLLWVVPLVVSTSTHTADCCVSFLLRLATSQKANRWSSKATQESSNLERSKSLRWCCCLGVCQQLLFLFKSVGLRELVHRYFSLLRLLVLNTMGVESVLSHLHR